MKFGHSAVAVCTALLIVFFGATTAHAAAPGNDSVGGATAVGPLPQTITEDTSEATTDALDAFVNTDCGAPFTNASVWSPTPTPPARDSWLT